MIGVAAPREGSRQDLSAPSRATGDRASDLHRMKLDPGVDDAGSIGVDLE